MKNNKLVVKTKSKTYPIYFGNNILSKTGNLIQNNLPSVKKVCVIIDNKIPNLLVKKLLKSLKKFEVKIYKLTVSEKTKSVTLANKIIESLLKQNFNRSDCVISFGGGITGDLSALVANLTKRGLKFINVPSTLLAQVDASMGGKTAVNSKYGKNLIGTYYQPDFILNDVSILKSLPGREMISGYGEILKHSLILNKKFFFWLLQNGKKMMISNNKKILKKAIIESCKIKCHIVNKDETEKGLRMILNFGHTFAHGFESAKNFSKSLNHGEAVLLGMMVASDLSHKKKLLPLQDLALIKSHYYNLKLPNNINKIFKKKEIDKIIYFMKKDKKNIDEKISLILLNKIGQTTKPQEFNLKSNKIKEFLKSYYI